MFCSYLEHVIPAVSVNHDDFFCLLLSLSKVNILISHALISHAFVQYLTCFLYFRCYFTRLKANYNSVIQLWTTTGRPLSK